MMEEKRSVKPLLLKFGVALALSFAGFIYARFKSRNIKPSLPPTSPCSSDHGNRVDSGRGRGRSKYNIQATKTTSSSNLVLIADDGHEETCTPKVSVDGSLIGLSPSSKHSGDKDSFLLPEFHDLVKELDFAIVNTGFSPKKEVDTPRSLVETPKAVVTVEKDEYEQEIRHLRNMVRMLRERERILEVQLLEYYGLKEQETAVMELQNRLKINSMESKIFILKIESLQADNRRLEAQVSDHSKVTADLEAARSKIKLLKKKLRSEAEQNKEQILNLQKRVVKLQEEEYKTADNFPDFKMKLRRLKDLECEVEELRKSNMRLQLENSDLGRRLETTQILANSVLEDSETEASKEEGERLRQENEDLTKEIERLQADRCADVEELVYLRWINACLRYELRNYQPPAGKTVARDLSKTLSPKSEEKAKQLILEYANTEGIIGKSINITDVDSDQWSSSQASFLTDSGDPDDTSVDFSSALKTNNSHKMKFISKLRRLIWGKDSRHSQNFSAEKSGSMEDSESPHCSSSISIGNEASAEGGSSIRFRNLSRSSSRPSLELRRSSCQKEDDLKIMDSCERNSDVSSSTYKRFVLGRQGSCDLAMASSHIDSNMEASEKLELMKYAEVFKDSREGKTKLHKKSASFSSF